jgi:hypothetical protein
MPASTSGVYTVSVAVEELTSRLSCKNTVDRQASFTKCELNRKGRSEREGEGRGGKGHFRWTPREVWEHCCHE